ncbi:MAG: TraM recognition domain-containing protein [Dysgonomonas sp.]
MEIIAIEKRTFELMKKRFEDFVVQVEKLCNQNQKTEWLNNEQVCEMLNISKRTLQSYRDNGRLSYSQIGHWVMSGDEFTLDINNPDDPKILAVGNNPDRQNIYGAALGLYNSRIVKLINKKGQLKSSVIIDELPTIYFKGLDNLIATARSNKVAVLLGFQDFSQLKRDYGDKEATVVMNTVGNIFSGQVVGDTAKTLSDRFGKVLQKRQSMTINRNDKSTSISTQMDSLIPPSKISNLTQGMFVGAIADNFDERIEQKIFHCEIVVDNERVAAETKAYKKIPVITNFVDENGVDRMKEMIKENYDRIKAEAKQIVVDELQRIKEDPDLCYLLPKEE